MTSVPDEATANSVATLLDKAGLTVDERELVEVTRRWQALVSTGTPLLAGLAPDGSGELILPERRSATS